MFTRLSNLNSAISILSILLILLLIQILCAPKCYAIVFRAEENLKYIHGENLIKNPGFEKAGGWKSYGTGYEIDRETKHSGDQSLKVTPRDENIQDGAYQKLDFDFKDGKESEIVISGWFKNEEGVSGRLYADVYSRDGAETQYGLIVEFDPDTCRIWQYNEKTFRIKLRKPFYVILCVFASGRQGKPGYFNDISVRKVMKKVDKGYSLRIICLPLT